MLAREFDDNIIRLNNVIRLSGDIIGLNDIIRLSGIVGLSIIRLSKKEEDSKVIYLKGCLITIG